MCLLNLPSPLKMSPALGIERINALFRNPIKYRQVVKPSSIGASTRCWSKSRP
jgi:hypothetical protein